MLNAHEIMAIAKAISSADEKTARAGLEPGEYEVSGDFHIEGKLSVADDQMIAATASLLNKEFLALVLHHAGITRENAMKVIRQVAEGYLVDWTGSKEDKKAAKAARKEAVDKYDPNGEIESIFSDVTAGLPKVPRAGKVQFSGEVAKVQAETTAESKVA